MHANQNPDGRFLYETWRKAATYRGRQRGHSRLPRWKELKPWAQRAWNDAAAELGVKA